MDVAHHASGAMAANEESGTTASITKPRSKSGPLKRPRNEDIKSTTLAPDSSSKRLRKEDIFPFLDLPAELQNRIYECAIEITSKSWPVIFNGRLTKRVRKGRSPAISKNSDKPPPFFPFLGLTQTCTKIRVAFRGWWMENHRIPLCELERYLSVFHPLPPLKNRHRFQAYVNTAGRLKVWLRRSEFNNKDLLPLLKLKLRLPNYTILFEHGDDVEEREAEGLSQLANNTNPEWVRWLRARIVTQVRTLTAGHMFATFAVVVRSDYAASWMMPTLGGPPAAADELSKKLGLYGLTHWKAKYTVCYG